MQWIANQSFFLTSIIIIAAAHQVALQSLRPQIGSLAVFFLSCLWNFSHWFAIVTILWVDNKTTQFFWPFCSAFCTCLLKRLTGCSHFLFSMWISMLPMEFCFKSMETWMELQLTFSANWRKKGTCLNQCLWVMNKWTNIANGLSLMSLWSESKRSRISFCWPPRQKLKKQHQMLFLHWKGWMGTPGHQSKMDKLCLGIWKDNLLMVWDHQLVQQGHSFVRKPSSHDLWTKELSLTVFLLCAWGELAFLFSLLLFVCSTLSAMLIQVHLHLPNCCMLHLILNFGGNGAI